MKNDLTTSLTENVYVIPSQVPLIEYNSQQSCFTYNQVFGLTLTLT